MRSREIGILEGASRFKCCGVPPKPFVDFLVEIALRQVCITDRAALLCLIRNLYNTISQLHGINIFNFHDVIFQPEA
jgi:hypothetical protein